MNPVSRFGSAFLLGAALGGLLLVVWAPFEADSTVDTMAPSTSSTVASVTAEPFFEPGEVLVDATALLIRDLTSEDGVVALDYDIAGLGPALMANEDQEYQGDASAVPESWVLTTHSGARVEATTGPRDSSVRFELPTGDDPVATIELVGWRVAVPLGERIELPIEKGAEGSFQSGDVVIETVLEQRNSTIVQIDFDRMAGDWNHGFPQPLEPGWRVSGMQGGGIQLIWDGPDVPDNVVLEDVSPALRPVTGSVIVIDRRQES